MLQSQMCLQPIPLLISFNMTITHATKTHKKFTRTLFLCHYHGIATSRILCRNILQPCCQLMGCCIWFHTLPFLLLHHDKEDYGIVCDAPCDMASLTNALHDNIVKLYNIFSHFVTHVNNTYMEVCVCCIEKATIFKSLKACNKLWLWLCFLNSIIVGMSYT